MPSVSLIQADTPLHVIDAALLFARTSLMPVYKATVTFLVRQIPQRLLADFKVVMDDMIDSNNDSVFVLSRCYGWRSKLLQFSRDLRIFDHQCFYEALQDDDNEVALLLQNTKENEKKNMISLRGNDARGLLDLIEYVIDTRRLESKSAQSVYRLLTKLYVSSSLLPPKLLLSGITEVESIPFAQGGFGEVFQGRLNGQIVVLKRLSVRLHDHETIRRMTICETMKWKELHHSHILPFLGLECATFPSSICMVSPWMPNGTISDFIRRKGDPPTRLRLTREIADGVAYLHSRCIIHGDLRGANILVDTNGGARLADFGLTKFAEAVTTSNSSNACCGSLRYMAPELLDSSMFDCVKARNTYATDVYAFACVCYEIYSGLIPFYPRYSDVQVIFRVLARERPARPTQGSEGSLNIPDGLWDLVQLCWGHNPTDRPSMSDAVQMLRRHSGDSDTQLYRDYDPEGIGLYN